MKKVILHCLFLFVVSFYATAEGKIKDTVSFTPFTGMDYVRIVFNKGEDLTSSMLYKTTITGPDGKILWRGEVKPQAAVNEGRNHLSFTVRNLKPVLWTPGNPFLYEIKLEVLKDGVVIKTLKERAGFRSFERRGGNLYLNGKPIFLRGIAINPPGRGIPDELENSRAFALDYVNYMKGLNVNIIRIPDSEAWFDVCDELGMMVFGGNYSGKVAGGEKVESQTKAGDENRRRVSL